MNNMVLRPNRTMMWISWAIGATILLYLPALTIYAWFPPTQNWWVWVLIAWLVWTFVGIVKDTREYFPQRRAYLAYKAMIDEHVALRNKIVHELSLAQKTWQKYAKTCWGDDDECLWFQESFLMPYYCSLHTAEPELYDFIDRYFISVRRYRIDKRPGYAVLVKHDFYSIRLDDDTKGDWFGEQDFLEEKKNPANHIASNDELRELLAYLESTH